MQKMYMDDVEHKKMMMWHNFFYLVSMEEILFISLSKGQERTRLDNFNPLYPGFLNGIWNIKNLYVWKCASVHVHV